MYSEEIYLYLPSSVYSYGGIENKINKYCTVLNAPIHLLEGVEYEAGVIKIIYPTSAKNVYNGDFTYYSYAQKMKILTRIAAGQYKIPEEFIEQFSKVLGYDKAYYKLTADSQSKKFMMECVKDDPYLELSQNLQALTGFPEKIAEKGYTLGEYWNSTGGLTNLYCYSDLIVNSNIGNTVAPVAAVIKYKQDEEGGSTEYEPQNPIYIPVSKTFIDTVTIEFRSKAGIPFPFMSGETMVVFHIRPKQLKL